MKVCCLRQHVWPPLRSTGYVTLSQTLPCYQRKGTFFVAAQFQHDDLHFIPTSLRPQISGSCGCTTYQAALLTCLVAVPADRVARPLPDAIFETCTALPVIHVQGFSASNLTSKIPRSARTFGPAKNFMQGRHTRGTAGSDKCLSIESPRSSGAHSIGCTQAKEGRIKQTRSTQNHIARHASPTIVVDNCQGTTW